MTVPRGEPGSAPPSRRAVAAQVTNSSVSATASLNTSQCVLCTTLAHRAAAAQVTNSAVSATTSSYTSQCVADFVPADADLVLVEFSVNDWEVWDASAAWMDNNQRCQNLSLTLP